MSWKVYQQEDNYGCNMLENFKVFQQAVQGSPLYTRGMVREPEGQFEHDAINDKLPAVSWIIPTSYQSEHPDYMPADGAAFVASKIDAIAANPEVWAKTAFILNYDENDGIFDHVAPPAPPAGTPREFVERAADRRRIPRAVHHRFAVDGRRMGVQRRFDHTSVLQFLEKFTGVREPNISDWRRQTFGDMTSALRFRDAKKGTAGAAGYGRPASAGRVRSHVSVAPRFPHDQPEGAGSKKRAGMEAVRGRHPESRGEDPAAKNVVLDSDAF